MEVGWVIDAEGNPGLISTWDTVSSIKFDVMHDTRVSTQSQGVELERLHTILSPMRTSHKILPRNTT